MRIKLFAVASFFAVFTLFAASGGPDDFGYIWMDEAEAAVTFDWIEPDTMTVISFPFGDDDVTALPLPFSVSFYDSVYEDSIFITTNGIIAFDREDAQSYNNRSIPDTIMPNALLAVYWDDLRVYDSSKVCYQVDGVAPTRVFTITWFRVFSWHAYSDPEDALFFQASIYEKVPDEHNEFIFQYLDPANSNLTYTNGASATVGIENSFGSVGLEYSFNTASLDSSRAIRFFRFEVSNHDCAADEILSPKSPAISGWPYSVRVVVRNIGTEDETTVPVFVDIVSPFGDTVYSEAETTAILADGRDTLALPDWTASPEGVYDIYCRVRVAGDTVAFNDVRRDTVRTFDHISSGGPDMFGYTWKDSYHPFEPPVYTTVPAGLAMPIDSLYGDDEIYRIALPFTFPYYSGNFDSVWVSTNGFLSFDSLLTVSYTLNDTIPDSWSPNGVLAAYWDDSDADTAFDTTASIRFLDDPGSGSCWIIFNRVFLPYATTEPTGQVTYGIRLFDDGVIEYHYLDAHAEDEPDHDYGASATVGIEDPTGTDGLVYEYNGYPPGNPLFDHFAIAFTPPWLGPDTLGPTILHTPEDLYADLPDFCVHLEAEIRDFHGIDSDTLYVEYPVVTGAASDSAVGNIYFYTVCGVMPGDTVVYSFAATDTLGNRATAGDFIMWVLNPHQGGPDITGYKFVDSWATWDTMSPLYNWIELNPDSGGPGTEIPLGVTGFSDPIPFSAVVPFYGLEAGGIIVSEDGWLCMDTTASLLPMPIPPDSFPHPDLPNGVIAPFWSDLTLSIGPGAAGGVYYYELLIDSLGASCMIIQWDMFPADSSLDYPLRFQAQIFYDNEYFGSRSVAAFRNIDGVDLDRAAICIEHETGFDGLAYWYKGEPSGAPIPTGNSSVLFYNPDLTDIAESAKLPDKLSLYAYPNPFNSAFNIRVSGFGSRIPDLEIFDINGRKIAEIPVSGSESAKVSSPTNSGTCRWTPDESLGSGIYFIRVHSEDKTLTRKAVLIK